MIYLHVESPDESGHAGNLDYKIQAIEDFDKRVVGPVLEGIKNSIKYAMELQKGTTEMVDSGFGIHAFDFWLNKVTDKNVNGHGNWWSNTVWAESRTMASAYMQEIKPYFNKDQVLDELSNRYNK